MKNTIKVGQFMELKNDNLNGIGNKGDKVIVLAKLYKPVDGWEIIVSFANGATEGLLERQLKMTTKTLDKITLIK